jgi:tRNA pseudouridine55 synthase
LETNIDSTFPTAHITAQKVREILTQFLGRIEQVPPAFSACKIDGHRAYNLARKGKEVQLKAKILVIDEIELQNFDSDSMQITIRVVCSKGTYIRALARDIGAALQSGAHLIALRRTRVGDIRVEDCMKMEDFSEWLEKQEIETESEND